MCGNVYILADTAASPSVLHPQFSAEVGTDFCCGQQLVVWL